MTRKSLLLAIAAAASLVLTGTARADHEPPCAQPATLEVTGTPGFLPWGSIDFFTRTFVYDDLRLIDHIVFSINGKSVATTDSEFDVSHWIQAEKPEASFQFSFSWHDTTFDPTFSTCTGSWGPFTVRSGPPRERDLIRIHRSVARVRLGMSRFPQVRAILGAPIRVKRIYPEYHRYYYRDRVSVFFFRSGRRWIAQHIETSSPRRHTLRGAKVGMPRWQLEFVHPTAECFGGRNGFCLIRILGRATEFTLRNGRISSISVLFMGD